MTGSVEGRKLADSICVLPLHTANNRLFCTEQKWFHYLLYD